MTDACIQIQARATTGVRPCGIGNASPHGISAGLFDGEFGIHEAFQDHPLVHRDAAAPVGDGLIADAEHLSDAHNGKAKNRLHRHNVKAQPIFVNSVTGIAVNQSGAQPRGMKSGKELGEAIDAARIKAGLKKTALARHFGVSPASVHDWVTRGTVGKERLIEIWRLFADAVPPEHWGLDAYPWAEREPAPVVSADRWRHWANLLAEELGRRHVALDAALFLDFVDAVVADHEADASEREASAVFERLWPLIKRGAHAPA